eukprot:COSAG02_NODE_42717_length_382_cov_0.547703_1_plen_35_part_01
MFDCGCRDYAGTDQLESDDVKCENQLRADCGGRGL